MRSVLQLSLHGSIPIAIDEADAADWVDAVRTASLRWMASDQAMQLAPQLGPLVLKMAGHARSVTLAQAREQRLSTRPCVRDRPREGSGSGPAEPDPYAAGAVWLLAEERSTPLPRPAARAQAARSAPRVLPELLRDAKSVEMPSVMLWVNQGGSPDACDEDGVTLLMRQARHISPYLPLSPTSPTSPHISPCLT